MALITIANGQLSDASQVDQFVNLLTGVMNDQVVTLKGDVTRSPGVLVLDSTTAAQKVAMQFADSGAAKWQVGKDTDNSFMIWDLVAARAGLRILSNGDGSVVAPIFKTTGASSLGSPTTSRFIGAWTTTGAPTGLTAQLNDYGFDGNNVLWVCSAAGTPGTWQAPAFASQANTWTSLQSFNGHITGSGGLEIVDSADTTKALIMSLSGMTTGKILTLAGQQTTSQTLNIPNIRETETIAVQPQYTSVTFNAPTGTSTLTPGVMQGLAGSITPQVTGRILFQVHFHATSSVASDGVDIGLRYGTGSAPAQGAALTGTAAGLLRRVHSDTANLARGGSVIAVITGLTLNTAYWLDVQIGAVTGGTASIFGVELVATEF